ncbi:ribonuclease toxin immunity protein CdiI [Listeria booriae]|uniref:CDI immunity protein domain-containing protein n=1 Tax=Listeria booriae TaxID=1552123 RepID=A0A7X0TKL8_9LIST|nr:ribonuclease toxin immunity protein CdiI [Listeria booriae]MBC1232567.1 hypothetical protein [Listeria booriae]MBC1246446.1 hypothetical protein [Listeria booriae]MBC1315435.1 hypothetical protein [Listeria booriae]MBC1330592.1 hypothetical protein [Listeria booriae]MBC2385902.1 hypothetical protein [Listeria booriae]
MKNETWLKDADLLDSSHYPVQAVFNMISDSRFTNIIGYISEGIGFGEEYGACTFPEDLDEYDIANGEGFDGVEFGLHSGEEIILDYQTLYIYLNKACENYIEKHPEANTQIQEYLEKYKKKYNISK